MFGALKSVLWRPLQALGAGGQRQQETDPEGRTASTPLKGSLQQQAGRDSSEDMFTTPLPRHPHAVYPTFDSPDSPDMAAAPAAVDAAASSHNSHPFARSSTRGGIAAEVQGSRESSSAAAAAGMHSQGAGAQQPVAAAASSSHAHAQPRSEEDKENGTSQAHKRSASVGDGSNGVTSAAEALERDAGRTSKRIRIDGPPQATAATAADPHASDEHGAASAASSTSATAAAAASRKAATRPAAPTRTLSSAAQTASVFNFGPLAVHKGSGLLFSKAVAAGAKKVGSVKLRGAATATAGTHSRSNSTAAAEQLSSSLHGVNLSNGISSGSGGGGDGGSADMEDVPADADVQMSSADIPLSRAPLHPPPPAASSHRPLPRSNDPSPTHGLAMPLHSLAISSEMSPAIFGGLSLSDALPAANNPFNRGAAPAPQVDPQVAARMAELKLSRSEKTKAGKAEVKRDRVAAMTAAAKELAAQEAKNGNGTHRSDIKSQTTQRMGHLAAAHAAHLPLRNNMRAPTKQAVPPVPLFSTAAPAAAASSAHVPAVSSASSRDRERERTPITADASHDASLARQAAQRAQREKQKEADSRRDRELAQQAKRRELQQREAAAAAAAEAEAAAVVAAELAAQQRAAASATTRPVVSINDRPAGLRRSARHSFSPTSAAASAAVVASPSPTPSSSPSPPPSTHWTTPSPKNRFVAPPMSAAGGVDGETPAAHTRTRSAQAAVAAQAAQEKSGPSPRSAAAAAAAAAQQRLSQSIAARKASDASAAAARLQDRQAALQAQQRAEDRAQREREAWQETVARRVAMRARGKGYVELLAEFAPSIRAEMNASASSSGGARFSFDVQRKAMRRAMATFHPDKHRSSPAKNKVEAEEIFAVLKKAYEELAALCR